MHWILGFAALWEVIVHNPKLLYRDLTNDPQGNVRNSITATFCSKFKPANYWMVGGGIDTYGRQWASPRMINLSTSIWLSELVPTLRQSLQVYDDVCCTISNNNFQKFHSVLPWLQLTFSSLEASKLDVSKVESSTAQCKKVQLFRPLQLTPINL